MNLIADAGVPRILVDMLRSKAYTVIYVAELQPGISDDVVLDLSNQAEAILITLDKDFGELVFRQKRLTVGVVLMRLEGLSTSEKAARVMNIVEERLDELSGAFTVITPRNVRVRSTLS